jgi:hypothetical protein
MQTQPKPVTSLTPPAVSNRALTYGTGYFPTFIDAVSYYRPYEGSNAIEAVVRKLNEGSIYIGKPVLKAGQVAFVTDHRWHIVEAAKATPGQVEAYINSADYYPQDL